MSAPDWAGLLGTAMVGTGRRALPPGVLGGLDGGAVVTGSPEAAVLAAAAVLGAYRRAGWTPPPWTGRAPEPAAADPRPVCSPAAGQVLELLLDRSIRVEGGNEPLIAYWLHACARAGQRPPAGSVVALLSLATTATALRQEVRTVTGPRGEWLARRNPRWSWAAPVDLADADRRFATTTGAERLTVLAAVRAADPAAGRALVEQTWAAEPAPSRAGLVDALGTGLSDADEPFLEAALDDRSAGVRAAAAALLDRLPASRRAARMAARVAGTGLPDAPDAAARRDGITDQREHGLGRQASWLVQLLGAAPLGPVPADLADAPAERLFGWTRAALRQRNEEWLVALARVRPMPELLAALPPERATALLADPGILPGSGPGAADARFAGLLAACPGPWPPGFSTGIVERLRTARTDGVLTLAFAALARHLHHATLPAVEAWIEQTPADRRARRRTLRGLAHALTIRRTIEQEFPT